MERVMHKQDYAAHVESIFYSCLSRYFKCECREDRQGNLVCDVSLRNVRTPSKPFFSRLVIRKEDLENGGYVHALTEKRVRDLIYPLK